MKQSDLIVLGLAGLAVYMIWQSQKPKTTSTGTSGPRAGLDTFVDEIFNGSGRPFDNGWRYFENGVAIDPSGNYYQGGQMVWQAPGAGA